MLHDIIVSFFFLREKVRFSLLSLSSLEASTLSGDEMAGLLRFGVHSKKESKIHHTLKPVALSLSRSRRTKCRVVSVCECLFVCLCLSEFCLFPMISTAMRCALALSFSHIVKRANSSRARSFSLSHSRSLASLQRWYYVHFVSCFLLKISRSFLEKAFFLLLRLDAMQIV